jgi:hypothetical protein
MGMNVHMCTREVWGDDEPRLGWISYSLGMYTRLIPIHA